MIRYLENQEKLNIKPLYDKCFDDSSEYKKYYFEEVLPENFVVVNEEDSCIRGMLHLIPKSVTVGKSKGYTYYIYGIATEEAYRKKGVMKELLINILNDMYYDMESFSYLIPASEEYSEMYKKFGFEYVMDKYELKDEETRKKPTHALISRKAENSDIARLSFFAEAMMSKKYGVYLSKDKEYFKNMMSLMKAEKGKIDLYIENRIILGYRIGFDDEVIEEVLDDTIQSMSWYSNTAKPYAMARILNVRKVLKFLGGSYSKEAVIKLSDPIIEENNGCFLWKYENNRFTWEKCELTPQYDMTIGELTAHIFGYKTIEGLPKTNIKNGFFINDYV